jgi:hypothetical protein
LFANQIKEDRSRACAICQRMGWHVGYGALSR